MMRSFCDTSPQAMPLIVTLDGQLDLFSREETRRKLRRLALSLNGIVDLRTARFGDATCLGDLAAARQTSSERGGTIVLVASDSWMLRGC